MTSPSSLSAVPRAGLIPLPTPFHLLERFSEAVGVEVWAKRDDVGPVSLAGNKVRKLEYLLADALASGCDVLVTTGAAQSNSARASAAAAAAVGMDAVLVLSGDEPAQPTGNLVVDRLVGAEIRFAGDVGWDRLDQMVREVASELRAQGRNPYTAPVGCSSPLGALGFAAAWFELVDQIASAGISPSAVYHTSTSGGTHAGLILGRALGGEGPSVKGVSAGKVQDDPVAHHRDLALESAALVGAEVDVEVSLDFSWIGPGYGVPTPEADEAIRLLARTEAILCDPVYSGKGLAGLVGDAPSLDGPVVFWHTGGWHALFHPAFTGSLLGR